MMPPYIARIRIHNPNHHFGLWIPVFLIWPIFLALIVIMAPFIMIGAGILWYSGWGKSLLLSVPAIYRCICATHGLRVDVKKRAERVFIQFI